MDSFLTSGMLFAVAIASAAGLMRGFAGVGSGMLMAPFFVHLFGPVDTVGIVILIEIVATAQLIPSVRHDIRWTVIGPMGAAAALAMPVGGTLLLSIDTGTLQFGVALLVTVSALLLMTGWRYEGGKPLAVTLGVGAVSGLLMALTSLGNPPVMFYLLSSRDSATTNRANFTGYFALTLAALLVIMLFRDLIPWRVVWTGLILLPPFMVSIWIGARMFKKSNEAQYRRVALGVLVLAGLYGMMR